MPESDLLSRASRASRAAAAIRRTRRRRRTVVLPGGARALLRPATLRDLRAVAALHALCAPLPPRPRSGFPDRAALPRLLGSRAGRGVLAEAPGRRPVGWASLAQDGDGGDAILLAAAAWRDRGLLGVLLAALAETAYESGCRTLRVCAALDDTAVRRAVTDLGMPYAVAGPDGADTVYTLRLPAPTAPGGTEVPTARRDAARATSH
ncbi:hypothetical protein [Streptomyces sp. NPDC059009]|uniref:hypothetical protein n=1 Tax=Streptomyces sp. NPDC059009 TaxID=3346694 RepID=UPI0036A332D4